MCDEKHYLFSSVQHEAKEWNNYSQAKNIW